MHKVSLEGWCFSGRPVEFGDGIVFLSEILAGDGAFKANDRWKLLVDLSRTHIHTHEYIYLYIYIYSYNIIPSEAGS